MNFHCSVMIGDESRGYLVPRGYCQNPLAYQHQDGKVYCQEHKHCASELDLEWVKRQAALNVPRQELLELVEDWQNRPILPKLQDGSLHPMDSARWGCGEILRKRLTAA